MPDCEINILADIPVNASLPNPTDVIIFTMSDGTSVIRTWSTILNGIIPTDIDFQVGVTPGFPSDGDTVYQNNALIGKRVRVFRQFLKQSTISSGGYSYSFNSVSGEITPSPAFSDEEVWSIEIY